MHLFAAALITTFLIASAVAADDQVDYLRDVQPLLREKCAQCHGPDEENSGLRLDTARAALAGGNSGPAIVAGDAEKSLLFRVVSGAKGVTRMPPEDESEKLTDQQIALLKSWINQGANFPADEQPIPTKADKAKLRHWAFQPIVRPEVPNAQHVQGTSKNEIDAFVFDRLREEGLAQSGEADRVTLIRRLSLDLTGLPPPPADVDAFADDASPDAYDQLVDRLLASPHYGERWGRWWLDQARYADTDGYSNDHPREMWKYRDWVIEAFNRNLPFNQFIIEQLAGDLLPDPTLAQRVATGFHRNTQTYSEGDSAAEEYRVENVVDRVHTTGVVFLGLTLGCARCHDHKFDPISQREFYQLFAFFNDQEEPRIDVPASGWNSPGEGLPAEKRPPMTTALVLADRQQPRETHIHIRGDYLSPGRQVTPGVPSVLPTISNDDQSTKRFTRLDLARWLVSPQHPLTSRVIVNRTWQMFFGKGIVETDDDFGTQGEHPTHPQLLDWLASEFQRLNWNTKALHRLIVTSAVYRQASDGRPELQDVDPRNQLLARQNRLRLDAELVRDSALVASGLLSRKIGGPSIFPPQPDGVMRLTQHADRRWIASQGEDRYRRGMYTFFWRLSPHPFLMAFNAPESNATCTRRTRANTPIQSLMLLNDEALVEAAQALAAKVLREAPTAQALPRLEYAFQLCLGRKPLASELSILSALLADGAADPIEPQTRHRFVSVERLPDGVSVHELSAWTNVARALLNLDEFITRE